MTMIRFFVLVFLVGALGKVTVFAQQRSNFEDLVTPGSNQEIFEPRYVSSKSFERMMKALDIRCTRFNSVDSKIFVTFATSADAERARTLLKRIDEAPRRIRAQIKLVRATDEPVSEGALTDRTVLSQLEQVFRFKGYRLLSEGAVTVNSREEGEFGLQGIAVDSTHTERYHVQLEPIFIADGKGVIKLDDLEVERKNGDDLKILETTLNIKNGETVVVGSANVEGRVYITIVTAMVVE